MKERVLEGVEALRRAGAQYGDVRFGSYRHQSLCARDRVVTDVSNRDDAGFGVRAYVDGAWGFASGSDPRPASIDALAKRAVEIARASASASSEPLLLADVEPYQDTWSVGFEEDPFTVSLEEKVDLLLSINAEMLQVDGIYQTSSRLTFDRESKLFASTIGTFTDQLLVRSFVHYSATAVGPGGFETRTYQDTPVNKGYEHIRRSPLLAEAPRVAREAVELLKAPECPDGPQDLILLPSHTCLVIHETIGHPTELDRVMGWEADYAGTSFATREKVGNYQYGSKIFNVVADRTMPFGRASVKYDDEGVKTGKWPIIKDGILSGYATTRSTASFVGESESRGCSYADSWYNPPILRMPNVSIEPGPEGAPFLDELIGDTKNGILLDGRGSYSIDHQRINFQFGADCCWKIENGKKKGMLRRTIYQSSNPKFWNSVDALCRPDEWRMFGVVNCGKGQPLQVAQLTHGSVPLRLRQVDVGRTRA